MQFQEIAAQSGALGGGAAAAGAHEFSQDDSSSIAGISAISAIKATSFGDYQVIRRNGSVVAFEPSKIAVAMTKAFIAVRGGQGAGSAAVREQVEKLTDGTVRALLRRLPAGGTFHIEDVQDQVEKRRLPSCRVSKTVCSYHWICRASKRSSARRATDWPTM